MECFEEFRADASGYLAGVISEREDREAGQLFVRRRRRDMAEDSKHGGWLEEEREKKRQKELWKAGALPKGNGDKSAVSAYGPR